MIKRNLLKERALDNLDRRILAAMVNDASQSYARLGEQVGLSSPAVHERVKKLKQAGVIRFVGAMLDPQAVDKQMLSFVHVDTVGWGKPAALLAFDQYPEVEEIHSVAGDTCLILKVRTRGPEDLEHFLAQLYAVDEVTATRSYVVLSTYLERPVQAGLTGSWPACGPTGG